MTSIKAIAILTTITAAKTQDKIEAVKLPEFEAQTLLFLRKIPTPIGIPIEIIIAIIVPIPLLFLLEVLVFDMKSPFYNFNIKKSFILIYIIFFIFYYIYSFI
jgi:hypothetical protein